MTKANPPGSEFDPRPGEAVTPDQQRAEALAKAHRRDGSPPADHRPPTHTDYNGWPLD